MNDPIVDEIRRIREAYAASFQYNLDAIYEDIKKREKASGRKVVSYVAAKHSTGEVNDAPSSDLQEMPAIHKRAG